MRNYVQLIGNITKDPEHKTLNGKDFIQFDIAVYKNQTKSDDANFGLSTEDEF